MPLRIPKSEKYNFSPSVSRKVQPHRVCQWDLEDSGYSSLCTVNPSAGCFRQRLEHGQRSGSVRELRPFGCSWRAPLWLQCDVYMGARAGIIFKGLECQVEELEMFPEDNRE